MINEEDFYFYRLLRAIKENNRYSAKEYASLPEKNCFLPNEKKIEKDFHLYPQAIENTKKVAAMCELKDFDFPVVFPVYQNLSTSESENLLWEKCIDGVSWRYPDSSPAVLKKVRERLSFEFEVIRDKKFCSYFLVVADIVSQSKINCGRGSGASSIVCFLLELLMLSPLSTSFFLIDF